MRRVVFAHLLWLAVVAAGACDGEDPVAGDDDDSAAGSAPEGCSEGTWGDLPVGEADLFVDAVAAAGGDGSIAAPLTSINAALELAIDAGETAVLIAAGTYTETVIVGKPHDGLRLLGRCPELVTLDASVDADLGNSGIWVDGEPWAPPVFEFAGMTITGAEGGALWLEDAVVDAHDLRLEDNRSVGCWIVDSDVTLRDVLIRGVEVGQWSYGEGMDVLYAASLDAERLVIEDVRSAGIFAYGMDDHLDLSLRDVEVRDTDPTDTGWYGEGIGCYEGVTAQLDGVVVQDVHSFGILAEAATVTVDHADVSGVMETGADEFGVGIAAWNGSTVTVRDSVSSGNAIAGVGAFEAGTSVRFERVAVRENLCGFASGDGMGVVVLDGAWAEFVDSVVEENCEYGVAVMGAETVVVFEGTEVRNQQPNPEDGFGGYGVSGFGGARLELSDSTITGSRAVSLYLSDEGTTAIVEGLTILETSFDEGYHHGRGIDARYGATLIGTDLVVQDSHEVGILLMDEGTTGDLQHVEVTNTHRTPENGTTIGLAVQGEAVATVSDLVASGHEGGGIGVFRGDLSCTECEITDNTFAGIVVMGGQLTMAGGAIRGNTSDANFGGGVGLFAQTVGANGPSTLDVEGVDIASHPFAGVWLDGEGSYHLAGCDIEGGTGASLVNGTALHGDGVVVLGGVQPWDGVSGLLLEGCAVHGAARAGVLLHHTSATLLDDQFSDNTVDLIWQGCDDSVEPEGIEEASSSDLCPDYDYLVSELTLRLYLEETEPYQ